MERKSARSFRVRAAVKSETWRCIRGLGAWRALLPTVAACAIAGAGFAEAGAAGSGPSCSLSYDLPGDVGISLPTTDAQGYFDELSWSTFLAINAPEVGGEVSTDGDNRTQWQDWSSTVDLIQCQVDPQSCGCPPGGCVSGDHFYPPECQEIPDFQNYRVLDQLSKVDDSFLQAANGSLSNDPLIDSLGKFVRYEIQLSPATYDFIVENRYFDESVLAAITEPVVFPCGEESYTGGDPADPRVGGIVLKNAWMELGTRDARRYHTEDLLVYNPAFRNSTGVASCEIKTMALVAMHINHKTTKQPNWIWSTFEHQRNAPDCTSLPPPGDEKGTGPSTGCPTSVSFDYNFNNQLCSLWGDPDLCQTCNAAPVSNAPGCDNPDVEDDVSWCLDQPPAKQAGLSQLCRQVPVADNYPTAQASNKACGRALGWKSAWWNYQLVSTQWSNFASDTCQNASADTDRTLIEPQVAISGFGEPTRPFLANNAIESYTRSNCIGCHLRATVDGTKNTPSTDLSYWLQLEVPAGAD